MKLTENKLRNLIRQSLLKEQRKRKNRKGILKKIMNARDGRTLDKLIASSEAEAEEGQVTIDDLTPEEAQQLIDAGVDLPGNMQSDLEDKANKSSKPSNTSGIAGPISNVEQDPIPRGDHDPIDMSDKKLKSLDQMRRVVYTFSDEATDPGGDNYEYHVKDDKWHVELLGTKKSELAGKMFSLHNNSKYQPTIDKLDKKYWFARSYDAPGRSEKVPKSVYKTALNAEDELKFLDASPIG